MKTGIIRRVDDLGRVVIPKEVRRSLGIKDGDALELSIEGQKVSFELYIPSCEYVAQIDRLIAIIKEDYEIKGDEAKEALAALGEARKALMKGWGK